MSDDLDAIDAIKYCSVCGEPRGVHGRYCDGFIPLTECPECGETAVTTTQGPLPVCLACDWTGWAPDDD
jgi:hypothetical protein